MKIDYFLKKDRSPMKIDKFLKFRNGRSLMKIDQFLKTGKSPMKRD